MNSSYNNGFFKDDKENSYDFKKEFFRYLFYWKYFLISTLFFLLTAFTYLRYTPKVYDTTAKIQIIDKEKTSLELPSASKLFSKSKINLENEIEVIKSYPILKEVVKNKKILKERLDQLISYHNLLRNGLGKNEIKIET